LNKFLQKKTVPRVVLGKDAFDGVGDKGKRNIRFTSKSSEKRSFNPEMENKVQVIEESFKPK
jgi:hypothetical protein